MYLLDHDGSIYVASSETGEKWPEQNQLKKLFGDWSGLSSTPTVVKYQDELYMCLLDHDGNIYVVSSEDGLYWPSEGELRKSQVFGDWSGLSSTPTLTVVDNYMVMCLPDNDQSVYISISSDGKNWGVPNLKSNFRGISYSEIVRWSPYDDFDKKNLDEILQSLDDFVAKWDHEKFFVAQVINTPKFSPKDHPLEVEKRDHKRLNDWIRANLQKGNIFMRDFVTEFEDTKLVVKQIIDANF